MTMMTPLKLKCCLRRLTSPMAVWRGPVYYLNCDVELSLTNLVKISNTKPIACFVSQSYMFFTFHRNSYKFIVFGLNKSASILLESRQWHCPHAVAAEIWRRRQTMTLVDSLPGTRRRGHKGPYPIDRYLPPAPGLQQTSCSSLLLTTDGADKQTDGRTDTVPLHRRLPLSGQRQ